MTEQPASRAAVANSAPIQPATDDHDAVLFGEHGPQPLGVVEGAQQMDAGDPGDTGEQDRAGAGGDDEGVVGHRAGRGVQFVVRGADARDLVAQAQLDAECLEVDVEGGALRLAEQHGLGQRRPVVRLMGLRADQGDRTGEPLLAQGHGGLHPCHPRTDDDDPALFLPPLLTHPITLGRRATRASGTREEISDTPSLLLTAQLPYLPRDTKG